MRPYEYDGFFIDRVMKPYEDNEFILRLWIHTMVIKPGNKITNI